MTSLLRWRARLWLLAMLVIASVLAGSCTCGPTGQPAKERPILACKAQRQSPTIAPHSTAEKHILPGATAISYSVTNSGEVAVSIGMTPVPGRGNAEPVLSLNYRSGNEHEGIVGVGFSLAAGSTISRCPRNFAKDGRIEPVFYDERDHTSLCLDGKRLVVAGQAGDDIEYRTSPDTHVRVIGHFENPTESHFDVFLPDGSVRRYGASAASRPRANNGMPLKWLLEKEEDVRGNGILFDWCFAEDSEGYVAETAVTAIRYSTFEDEEPQQAVVFSYKQREDVQSPFSRGMQFQESLQLAEVQMQTAKGAIVRRYELAYETSETTGRQLLVSVQECADGSCYAPTRFHYAQPKTGFEEVTTDIEAPLSDKASPMFFDVDHDGRADYVVGDSTPFSTPEHPITEWRIARNIGGSFAQENVALLQEWSFVQNPPELADPTLLQPELGTATDVTGDGRLDLFLHDTTGSQANHLFLKTKPDLTFERVDSEIPRPFPLQQTPKGLRNEFGSVHLVDVSGDAIADLVVCDDHGDTLQTAQFSTWKVHLWRPEGFATTGEVIDTMLGIPCGVAFYPADTNGDSVTDVVVPGYLTQGGVAVLPSGTYNVHRRRSDGTWETFDTLLPTPIQGRTLFLEVNGDGLPDAIQLRPSDSNLMTYLNIGLGFSENPIESLPSEDVLPEDLLLHLAQPLQFDGDHRTDLLVPMRDSLSPDIPRWVILRATGHMSGPTFEVIESGIPFEPVLSDAVTLADPRGPRITDIDGDGASDMAIFLGGRLHIFRNTATNADVLVGFSDGTNDHDTDEPGFVPNVSFSYGHLTDESMYVAQDDPANKCAYPRHCAVGAKRVVNEYRTNDGQGGERRYGVQYRDGRYDRVMQQWLGFGRRIVTDLDTGATTVEVYDNVTKVNIGAREVFPFMGQVVEQWQWAPGLPTQPNPNQVEMVFVERTIDVVPTNEGASYFTLPTKTRTRRMQGTHMSSDSLEAWVANVEANENATMLRDTTVDIAQVDEFGHVLRVDVSTVGVDLTLSITRTIKNDTSRWILGQLQFQEECSSASGLSQCRSVTRTTNEFGEVETESTDSNDGIADTKLNVAYDKRDKYGNIEEVTATDAFGHKRRSTTVYDEHGIYPTTLINAFGHATDVEYDARLGVLTKETDPNGLSAEWKFNGLGQLTLEKRPDGSETTITRTREKIDGVWRTKQRTTTTGGEDDETIFDSVGRPIQTFAFAAQPENGKALRVMQRIEYDRLSGNVSKRSVPTAEGAPDTQLKWDTYAYDAIGREIRHTTPWNALTSTSYDGFFVDSTDPLLNHTKTEVDPLGRPKTVTDAANGQTKYTYGPFDTLHSVIDPGGDVTKWSRDAFGRVRQLEEPDRGTTTLVHNGFGDLLASMDALGRVATFGVDALGRVETRTDKLGAQTSTTTWTWDSAPHGIGKLHSVVSPDAAKSYTYTERGQLDTVKLGVEGVVLSAQIHYNEIGLAESLDYPEPLGMPPFGVKYSYDEHGYRIEVRDKHSDEAYWQLTDVDQTGRYREETFGNGTKTTRAYYDDKQALKSITTHLGGTLIQDLSYDWDPRLNLKMRKDARQPTNTTERFKYDGLNRLTCAYFALAENPNAPCATSFGYAPNGNPTYKSDVGVLSYADPKHPHAITSIPGETFSYNAVGNQITRPGGVSITYTAFDLPKTISQPGKTVSYGYDGDQQRIRKTTVMSETLYFEDLFEQVKTGATKEFRYYVHSPERVVAIVTRGGNAPGTAYLHVDHVGSTESVTDEKGSQVEQRSYDPFGQRRNVIWGLPPPTSFANSKVRPGFTGHDEGDESGLVNMKGRLLDPRLGRFTTTDPVIADVFNGQTLNGFSYVRNNPLTLVDPSGFTEEEAWRLWRAEETGALGLHITFDKLAQPTLQTGPGPAPSPAPDIGASAPTIDMGTMGPGDTTAIPVVETTHPSGPGTDDPFGVYPPDIDLDRTPITTFEQLSTGSPTAGRRTLIIEDEPGIARDLRYVLGPPRETVVLRPRIGGEAGNAVSRAKQNLIGEGVLTIATMLIPGTLDDIAAAGLRGGARAGTYGELRALRIRDAHHIIQDAAVRDLPGYNRARAPAVELPGPSTRSGTPHFAATEVQRQAGGGTFAAERRIGYKALRKAGMSPEQARAQIHRADEYFRTLGVGPSTPTRIPGTR